MVEEVKKIAAELIGTYTGILTVYEALDIATKIQYNELLKKAFVLDETD